MLDTTTAAIELMPTFIKENEETTRTSSSTTSINTEAYARSTLLPAETETSTIGPGGYDTYQGLYQVDLFFPINEGAKAVNYMVDSIIAAFPKGSLSTQDGVQLRIVNYWREASLETDNWFMVPVVIQWESFIQR